MAENKQTEFRPVPVAPAATSPVVSTPTTLEAAIAKIAELMERQTEYNEYAKKNAPRRKKTMADYLRANPRKRLKRPSYQNGREINPKGLSDATIDKLDTLAPGRYADGTVQVVRIDDGDSKHSRIHLMYSNKSLEQRMLFYMKFPSFSMLVNTLEAEMLARGVKPVRDPEPDPVVVEIPEEE